MRDRENHLSLTIFVFILMEKLMVCECDDVKTEEKSENERIKF